MMYFKEQNIAFHHIYKTGGTSVKHYLWENFGPDFDKFHYESNHESLEQKIKFVGGMEEFKKINVFTSLKR